jgi:hypothetical protein
LVGGKQVGYKLGVTNENGGQTVSSLQMEALGREDRVAAGEWSGGAQLTG